MGLLSNRVSKEELSPGDHIYSWRFAYSYAHHGIYIGDGLVIHFTRGQGEEIGTGTILDKFAIAITSSWKTNSSTICQKCSIDMGKNGVALSCLDCFLCGCPLYRFQYSESTLIFLAKARGGTCTLAICDPPEVVLHRAQYLLANGFGCYHIFHNNCEDFAIYCKTGLLVLEENAIGRSGQAVSFLGAPFAAVSASPLRFLMAQSWGLLAISAGVYCLGRYAADIGIRKDVAKISVEDLVVRLGPSMAAVSLAQTSTTATMDASLAQTSAIVHSSYAQDNAIMDAALTAYTFLPQTSSESTSHAESATMDASHMLSASMDTPVTKIDCKLTT